jgi:SulP family sulfate permease
LCCTSIYLIYEKASDLGEKGIIIESVENLKDEKPWQDELPFYDEYKDKVLIKHLKGPLFFDLQRISKSSCHYR